MITVDTGDVHEFVKIGVNWMADNQEGITSNLVIPELDMVDVVNTGAKNNAEGESKHLFLPFSHQDCDDASLTGGKGSSLGLLIKNCRLEFVFMFRAAIKN